MANREYFVGETIHADGDYYRIVGKITYRNKNDGKTWEEYRLQALNYNEERWLAVDNYYNEFSLSRINLQADTLGFHVVDKGVEQVIATSGDVGDVEVGDSAPFEEYEDSTEELIVSIEHWSDGDEYSTGYYLDPWEFGKDGEKVSAVRTTSKKSNLSLIIFAFIFIMAFAAEAFKAVTSGGVSISKYLKKSSDFNYVTSITGSDKKKADVYEYSSIISSAADNTQEQLLNDVAKKIINGIEGEADSVQQNSESDDKTVAILTNKEYCIVYLGEDDKVYVQVSSREYTYTTDKQPYRSRSRTHRYYRRFYYSTGYNSDSGTYSSRPSSYSNYSDGTVDYDSGNSLNVYSGNVRQQSINSRSSSGGGLSSGK